MTPACQKVTPAHWALIVVEDDPAGIKSWENVLGRRTYSLHHAEDPGQVLYCYCEKRPGRQVLKGEAAGQSPPVPRWHNRYGGSQQANSALLRAWEPRDGWADESGTHEDLVATLKRLFVAAIARSKAEIKSKAEAKEEAKQRN